MIDFIFYILLLMTMCLIVFLWFRKTRQEEEGKPLPGPPLIEGLKIFMQGMLNNTLHLYLTELAQKYGDIMQINLLIKKVVFINSAETFKRLVKDKDLQDLTNDRPPTFFAEFVHEGENDIVLASFGPKLREKRKIFHGILKFYGEGRGQFEELVVRSLAELTDTMKKSETFDLSISIRKYILNLLGFLLTGDTSEAAKQNLGKLKGFSDAGDGLFVFEVDSVLHAIPQLRYIPGLRYKQLCDAASSAKERLFETYFYAIRKTFNADKKRGMVDELLSIQQEMGSDGLLDDITVKGIICDVVAAGYLTSSSTLTSLFLYLIKHQDIQDRVYKEIKTVMGDSTPSFKHRQHMPYTEAAILEILRISSIVPLLVPHFVREDIVFDGYFIPRSTTIMMNSWYNHHREDFWEDPDIFRPERFLKDNGQLLEPDHPIRQRLIAFGTGRRACPGETFGRSRVFLIATFLLQKFQFVPDKKELLPSLNPVDWAGKTILCPDNYKCKVILRSG